MSGASYHSRRGVRDASRLFPVAFFAGFCIALLRHGASEPGFVAPPGLRGRLTATSEGEVQSRTSLEAGPADLLGTLQKLPGMVSEVVEDFQDMFLPARGPGALAQLDVSSLGMAHDGLSKTGLLQTMSLRAVAGAERRLSRQVAKLVEEMRGTSGVLTATATQNPQDPGDFVIFIRYVSMQHMSNHQSGSGFKESLEKMEDLLERPIGLYLVEERLGEIGMARHPFGPGGEGGRDDAIYSSRKS